MKAAGVVSVVVTALLGLLLALPADAAELVRKEVDPDVQQELYEHPADSLNLTKVIKSDGPASHVQALAQTLEAWKFRARAAQLPSDETMTSQLSSEELRRLRALGYVGGGTAPRPATNTAAANTATNITANGATNIAANTLTTVTKTNVVGATADHGDGGH